MLSLFLLDDDLRGDVDLIGDTDSLSFLLVVFFRCMLLLTILKIDLDSKNGIE